MPRTTDDPKQQMVTIRMSDDDLQQLDLLAAHWSVSRSAVLRRLLRRARRPKPKKKKKE